MFLWGVRGGGKQCSVRRSKQSPFSPLFNISIPAPFLSPSVSFTMLPLGKELVQLSNHNLDGKREKNAILHLHPASFLFPPLLHHPLIEPNPNVQSLLEKEFGEPKPSWKKERSVEYAPESKGLPCFVGHHDSKLWFSSYKVGRELSKEGLYC